MLIFNHDALRDPIWQFFGVIISLFFGVLGLLLPYLLRSEDEQQKLRRAYLALVQQDNSLGCMGSIGLLFFLAAACYSLYHLLLRMFLLDRSIDPNALVATTVTIVVCVTLVFTVFRQNQLLLLLAFHFCVITVIFSLLVVSLKQGTFIYKDFTFVKLSLAHYIPPINNIPLPLKKIPVDIIITDRAASQTIFIWVYGISLFFFLFFYGVSKRTEGLRAFVRFFYARGTEASSNPAFENPNVAFEFQSPERREITLQKLAKLEKEVALEEKRLDVEKKRIAYARDLSATLASTLEPQADATTRAMLIRQYLPDFLKLGTVETAAIVVPHLEREVSPAPLETASTKSSSSFDLVVPDLLKLHYYHAAERALEAGMKIVVMGEELQSDTEPGTVIHQYPVPESRINRALIDASKHSFEISVILSKQRSVETLVLPAIVQADDSEIPSGDETQQSASEESPIGNEVQQPVSPNTSPGDETLPPTSQEASPGEEAQQPAPQESPKEKPGKKHKKPHGKSKHENKMPLDGATTQPDSQKSPKEKPGKKHQKHGKEKGKSKASLDGETSQSDSRKSLKEKPGKKHQKRPDKDINVPLPVEDSRPISQELEAAKPVELPAEETPDSSALPLITDQHEEEQTLSTEGDQISQKPDVVVQSPPIEEHQTLEDLNEVAETSLPPTLPIEEIVSPPTLPEEQVIYLGPDDQLTDVLERIAGARAQQILLVMPPQTHMRSYVSWRLLHARVRELGKIVQVISMDRQIRAVAKAAGFRVAHPLESPASSNARLGSRPNRGELGRNTRQFYRPLRSPSVRGGMSVSSEGTRQSDEQAERQSASVVSPPHDAMPEPAPEQLEDPFALLEDISSLPLPEQRGSILVDDLDENLPDISAPG